MDDLLGDNYDTMDFDDGACEDDFDDTTDLARQRDHEEAERDDIDDGPRPALT